VTNATDDGVAGFAVDAWCDEVRQASGAPISPKLGVGETKKLVAALVELEPDPAKREEAARREARQYVEMRPGGDLNVHGFVDWLSSGRKERPSGARKALQPAPSGTPAFEIGMSAAEEERIRKETEDLARRAK
jgi:hypothetical protein